MTSNNPFISCIIVVRDIEKERLLRCIDYVKLNGWIYDILVVDYSSKSPIRGNKDFKVLRVDGKKELNKAHAINLGIKHTKGDVIMTLDVDMLTSYELLESLIANVTPKNVIFATNVRRILPKDISEHYSEMIVKSKPFYDENKRQLFNEVNGGLQVYPREFIEKVKGIPESLGKYWGAEDNWVYYQAKMNGYNIVDLSLQILHVEHARRGAFHEPTEEFKEYVQYKADYLDYMIREKINFNQEPYVARKNPCLKLYNTFLNNFKNKDKILQECVESGRQEVCINFQTYRIAKEKPSILIAVMNNYETIPSYFAGELLNLYSKTKLFYPDTALQQFNAHDIALMRNMACKYALGGNPQNKRFDFIVFLDVDQKYPPTFINHFITTMEKKNYLVMNGLTKTKKEGNLYNAYKKIKDELYSKDNCLTGEEDKITKVEATGGAGLTIYTKALDKLQFPYFASEYYEANGKPYVRGEDVYFSLNCKNNNIPIYVDPTIKFKHEVREFI